MACCCVEVTAVSLKKLYAGIALHWPKTQKNIPKANILRLKAIPRLDNICFIFKLLFIFFIGKLVKKIVVFTGNY